MGGENNNSQPAFDAPVTTGGQSFDAPITAGNSEISSGFTNFDDIRTSMMGSTNTDNTFGSIAFYDSNQPNGLRTMDGAISLNVNGTAGGESGIAGTNTTPTDTTAPGDMRDNVPTQQDSQGRPVQDDPEHAEAAERNSKTIRENFGDQSQDVRDAAYRELMRSECIKGYPQTGPGADADRKLLDEKGLTDKVNQIIRDRAKEGKIPHCAPMS